VDSELRSYPILDSEKIRPIVEQNLCSAEGLRNNGVSMAKSTAKLQVTKFQPSELLASYVSHYGLRQGRLNQTQIVRPIYARTQQTLEFYLQDRYRIQTTKSDWTMPGALLAGPSTGPKGDLIYPRTVRTFTVNFYPAGFHALFRLPMHLLADEALPADSVLGNSVSNLLNELQNAVSNRQLVAAVDAYLVQRVRQAVDFSPVQLAARWLRREHGASDLAALARRCNLSVRQFERQFQRHVGIPPKVFSRVARLEYAILGKQASPRLLLTTVAADAGYFDHAHFIRDVRALAGATPRRLLAALPDMDLNSVDAAAVTKDLGKFAAGMSHLYNSSPAPRATLCL
jgi:AraC-like DNA-binding protein